MAKNIRTINDWKTLRKEFLRAGYTIDLRRNGHETWNCPTGPVFASSTPSDKRALKNHISMLTKKGVTL